jgi:hypothetical protein
MGALVGGIYAACSTRPNLVVAELAAKMRE